MTYRTTLVGYDRSESATRPLNIAVELAKNVKEQGIHVRIVVAADTKAHRLFQPLPTAGTMGREMLELAKNLLSDATHMAKRAGIPDIYGSTEECQPADVILTLTSEYKPDPIEVGRRGVRGLQRFLMGSVSSAVFDDAAIDVLVVK